METRVYLNGHDISDRNLVEQMSIRTELSNWQCTASLMVRGEPKLGDVFPMTLPFELATPINVANRASIRITDTDDNTLFGGYVVQATYSHLIKDETHYSITCESWQALLDAFIVSVDYEGPITDKQIIEDIVGEHVPEFDTSNVAACKSYDRYVAANKSIWAILKELAAMANAEVWANGDKEIFYDDEPYTTAPWDISDTPGAGQVDVVDLSYAEDSKEMANRVIVMGGPDLITGEPVYAVADDEDSQAEYGYVFPYTISDGSITIQALAEVLAEAELERRSQPKRTGTFKFYAAGWQVGQLVHITNQRFKLSNREFLIRSVETRWTGPQDCEYTVTFGDKIPTLVDALRGISQTATSGNAPRPAFIPAESVTGEQLAQGVLNSLTKYGPKLRPIITVATLPTLPDAEFPSDSYVFLTTDNKIYKNNAGTWEESTAPVGSYIPHHVGTFLAGNMVGAIISDQIDSIAVEKMYGEISSSGDVTVNVNALDGEINGSGNVTINADVLVGGTIAAGKVSIHGGNIQNATIGDGAIIELNGSKLQNLTVTNAAIADGTIQDVKINSLSVGKLTAGNVAFGSATTIGYNSDYKLSLQSNAVRIEASSSRFVQITSGGATLQYDTDNVVTLTGSALTIVSGGGQKLQATSSGVAIQADANRKITVGDGSGNITIEHGTSKATLNSTGIMFEASATVYSQYTASGLQMVAGSNSVVLNPSGLQMNAGQIGLGASSFASSPIKIEPSGITIANSGNTLTVNASGVSVGVGNLTVMVGSIATHNGSVGAYSGGYSTVIQGTMFGGVTVNGVKVVGNQQPAVADATDATSVIARFNELLARLRTHGLIAT